MDTYCHFRKAMQERIRLESIFWNLKNTFSNRIQNTIRLFNSLRKYTTLPAGIY